MPGVLYLESGKCHIRSKRGNVLERFDELCFLVPDFLDARDAILDGEILSLSCTPLGAAYFTPLTVYSYWKASSSCAIGPSG